MLSKGTVNEWVVSFLQRMRLSKQELLRLLFSFQNQKLVPIAPFHFQNGELMSELVAIVISDSLDLLYLTEEDHILRLAKKATDTFSVTHELDPQEIESCSVDLSTINQEPVLKLRIKEKTFDCHLMAPREVLEFAKTLPVGAEIGVQFCLHMENPIFRSAIPLAHWGDNIYCAFVEKSPDEFQITHVNRNHRRLKSFTYNMLGSSFDEMRFEDCLELIYYNLLPHSTLRIDAVCRNSHINRSYHEEYVNGILAPLRTHCSTEGCFSSIDHTDFVVSNERIFDAWRNGVLMEWFAGSTLKKSGMNQALWHVELSGIHCDAVASWEDEVVVIECKRTDRYGDVYKEGVKHLAQIRSFFESNGISAYTILMTTIHDTPRQEKGIDALVTQHNYVDFCEDPTSLL